MTTKRFPQELTNMMRGPGVRAAWVSDFPLPKNATAETCQNCNGHGFFTAFIAMSGPFKTYPNNPKAITRTDERGIWVGETFAAKCPVCRGDGRQNAS